MSSSAIEAGETGVGDGVGPSRRARLKILTKAKRSRFEKPVSVTFSGKKGAVLSVVR